MVVLQFMMLVWNLYMTCFKWVPYYLCPVAPPCLVVILQLLFIVVLFNKIWGELHPCCSFSSTFFQGYLIIPSIMISNFVDKLQNILGRAPPLVILHMFVLWFNIIISSLLWKSQLSMLLGNAIFSFFYKP